MNPGVMPYKGGSARKWAKVDSFHELLKLKQIYAQESGEVSGKNTPWNNLRDLKLSNYKSIFVTF